jgi:alkylation response protein AidB-like acyl-CoA dehydrogenase
MDFADSPEHAAFRAEFRHWLEANLPPEICVDDVADQRVAPDRETLEKRIAWQKKMHAAGWVGISWPKEYGGRGAGFMEQVIFDEEYFRARAPVLPTASALNLLGPTLIHWGNEEQKRRHLPRILSADELWCQGYSEPDAGGDLASLRTRAVDDGDHFVVNGQKVWTSGAHFADWCFLLVRTDPDAPKHHGISYLLVDMKTQGVTVRPLVLKPRLRQDG